VGATGVVRGAAGVVGGGLGVRDGAADGAGDGLGLTLGDGLGFGVTAATRPLGVDPDDPHPAESAEIRTTAAISLPLTPTSNLPAPAAWLHLMTRV
jgi:hypothetical protein